MVPPMLELINSIPFAIITTGALVGVAAALLGTFLVLGRSSMLTDAISHSILFGIMVVWLLTRQQSGPVQIVGAALTGLLTVSLTELLTRSRLVKADAAIGLVFPALFAAGALMLNLFAREVHIDAHTVLLGEIGFVWLDTVVLGGFRIPEAMLTMAVMTVINLAFVVLFYKELKLTTFDRGLAVALGYSPTLLFYALLSLTSATSVAAFDAVGVVLLIAFVVVPPSAAYLLTDRLWRMLLYAASIAIASSVIGYLTAVALDVSIGGSMALATGGFLLIALLISPRYGIVAQELRRSRQRRSNETRALVVHLYHHEASEARGEENLVSALLEHLHWSDARAQAVLLRCLDQGLVRRAGPELHLTLQGRAMAQEIVEPWRQSAVDPAVAAGD
jgi:manganese/zinc/iron transport system permease protein